MVSAYQAGIIFFLVIVKSIFFFGGGGGGFLKIAVVNSLTVLWFPHSLNLPPLSVLSPFSNKFKNLKFALSLANGYKIYCNLLFDT